MNKTYNSLYSLMISILIFVVLGRVLNNVSGFEEIANQVSSIFPFMFIACLILIVISALNETVYTTSDELPDLDFNKLKFWEWRIRYYIPFYFIVILLTNFIDKGIGFIISIILSWISLYKFIQEYNIWIKKEGEK